MILRFLGWVIAIVFGVAAAGAFAGHEYLPGAMVFVAALLAFPPIWRVGALGRVPGWLRALGVVLALLGLGETLPRTPASDSSQDASGPSKTAREAAVAATSPEEDALREASAIDQPKWAYANSKDEMRGTMTRFASVDSDNVLEFGFPYSGGSTGTLTLRKRPQDGLHILLAVSKGQFQCNALEGGHVIIKFDNRPLEEYPCYEPSDATTGLLFIGNEKRFLDNLRGAKKVTVEAEFFQEGPRQLVFETHGLRWE